MTFLYVLAAVVILVEALNKLERTDLRGRKGRALVVTAMKAIGWGLLAIGCGGVVIQQLFPPGVLPGWMNDLQRTSVVLGFAVLWIRSRVQETAEIRRVEPDDFNRTMVIRKE